MLQLQATAFQAHEKLQVMIGIGDAAATGHVMLHYNVLEQQQQQQQQQQAIRCLQNLSGGPKRSRSRPQTQAIRTGNQF
jgi:hypothetical protein